MALSVHIVWGYAIGPLQGSTSTPLPYNAQSSEDPAASSISATSAPASAGLRPMLSVSAAQAILYVTGPSPDINNGPFRYFDPNLQAGRDDIFVDPKDKFAWKLP